MPQTCNYSVSKILLCMYYCGCQLIKWKAWGALGVGDKCVSATVEEVCSVHTRRLSNSLFNVLKPHCRVSAKKEIQRPKITLQNYVQKFRCFHKTACLLL